MLTTLTSFALAALLAAQPSEVDAPIAFDTITLKAAEALHGQEVTITFAPGCPCDLFGEGENLRTVAAPADTAHFSRTVYLKGNRLRDADLGCKKLTVRGTLRVVHHPGVTIGETFFEPFTEVRLEE